MKIRVSPRLTVAEAERMARGLGCDLRLEAGQAYLVRRRDSGGRHRNTDQKKEPHHGRKTDT